MRMKLFQMPPFLPIALFLSLAAGTALASVEDKIEKSFQVKPGEQLVVDLERGSIEIKTGETDSVSIEITRTAGGSKSKAEKTLKDHEVSALQNGGKVEVRTEFKGSRSSGLFSRSPELQVRCVVTVPGKFEADLKTAGGSIRVSELTGKVHAHTSGGSMKFERIEGPVSAQTSGGSITVATAKGPIEVTTSGGSLTLTGIDGDVTAMTSGGSIRAEKLNGKTVVKTSGGSIKATGVRGSIQATTSGGGIEASLAGQPTGDCTFRTSAGSVTIHLAADAAVDVDVSTRAGRVTSEFPVATVIQGEQKKDELRGKINDGGPLLKAQTSAGNVRLAKQ